MLELLRNIQLHINEKIFIKDPYTTDLGKSIIKESLVLIDEMGLEEFTFKKLAVKIGTTESSIYRYFNNKHRLLIYLMSWYWGWLEYKLVFRMANLSTPEEKLIAAISELVEDIEDLELNGNINLTTLSKIAISESAKSYLTKEIDTESKDGFFSSYFHLCKRISLVCHEINPDFKYSKALVSTIYEGIHHQKFFSIHINPITEFDISSQDDMKEFFINIALNTLKKGKAI